MGATVSRVSKRLMHVSKAMTTVEEGRKREEVFRRSLRRLQGSTASGENRPKAVTGSTRKI